MIDFNKMDDKDFVFLNKSLSEKDDEAFSDFLKDRKKKRKSSKQNLKKKKLSV